MSQLDTKRVKKILVIKLRYVGDVLLSTPVLAALRTRFPHARVVMVVNRGTEGILNNNPHVDDVMVVPRKGWVRELSFLARIRSQHFDVVIDLTDGDRSAILSFLSGAKVTIGFSRERNWRKWVYSYCVTSGARELHTVDYQLQVLPFLGIQPQGILPRLYLGEAERTSVQVMLKQLGMVDDPFAVLHPAARYWSKAWPPERFAQLSDRLVEHGLRVVLVGMPGEESLGRLIQRTAKCPLQSLIGQTTLSELGALLERCRVFIGNDGGPMHMAAAVGTPVVALFGPSDPFVWAPKGERTTLIHKKVDCSKCSYPGCVRGEFSCMKQISVEEVFEAARKTWR